jgi:hypothetical protein
VNGHLFRHDPREVLVVNKKGRPDEEEQLVQLKETREHPWQEVEQLAQIPLLMTKGKGHWVTQDP